MRLIELEEMPHNLVSARCQSTAASAGEIHAKAEDTIAQAKIQEVILAPKILPQIIFLFKIFRRIGIRGRKFSSLT